MSSHHIVREKQEPALLILDNDNFPAEQLGQLLEWSPTVFTSLSAAEKLNSMGIKIDFILQQGSAAYLQSDIKVIPVESDNLIEICLKYLIVNGYSAVNIITESFQLKDIEYYADKINIVIFEEHKKIFAISPKFSRWKTKGETIEFLTEAKHLHVDGLEKVSSKKYITVQDGFYSVLFEGTFLFIAEEI